MEEHAKKTPSIWKGAAEFIIILGGCMALIFAASQTPPLMDVAKDLHERINDVTFGPSK